VTRCPRCQRRLPPSGECPTHGRATGFVTSAASASPEILPPRGWNIDRYLATGGTSHAFAVKRDDGTPAILKWGRWRDHDISLRFDLEAKVLRMVGAPWTPALFEHGAIDGWPYLIMELIAGETLAAWMSRLGERGGLGEILALLDQIAAALTAIHAAGVIHRDLKPENVLIGARGVRLIDFGLAKQPTGLGITQVGAVVGTVHYLAPEQVHGTSVDHRADIYSFGVVAFEMLCGGPPFFGERRAIEYQHSVCRPPSVREWRDVPDELEQLVAACLAKQPEARPQSGGELRNWIARAVAGSATARGVVARALGVRGRVALIWIEGCDPATVVSAVGDVNGLVVRHRRDGVLAAFAGLDHDMPLAAALAAAEALSTERARCVIHVGSALLRRSPQGKVAAYGDDVEHFERWLPVPPFSGSLAGTLLTAAAAELAPGGHDGVVPSPEAPGFFRPGQRDRTTAADARATPPLVGRSNLVESLAAIAVQALVDARPAHIAITGDSGLGKTRVLGAIVDRLRAGGHDVIALRGRRRFAGERPDERLLEALGGGELGAALDRASARGALIALDDAAWIPGGTLRALDLVLARRGAKLAVITTSAAPLAESDASHRIDVALQPLTFDDAEVIVRDLLRPARLIPNVLVERLAIRAGGNPGLLVALTGEITRRGAVRRHVGSDEWYVAADELDTLLAAPSPAWFAVRALEELPPELVSLVRICAGLGPRFCADEIAAVRGDSGLAESLAWLVRDGMLYESGGWYIFNDAGLQDALYDHALDERGLIHGRAFHYWLARDGVDSIDRLVRLAHHGAGAHEVVTATMCFLALARAARDRSDDDSAEEALDRALACLANTSPRLQATTLIERARIRHARRRFEDACQDARRARRLAERAGDLELQLDALVADAVSATAAGRIDAASAACTAAGALATADIAVAVRARVLAAIGAVRAQTGQLDEAITTLRLAASLAEALGDRDTARQVARTLSQTGELVTDDLSAAHRPR
jgi:eukaryotic-like serine/threonine-protein kinase